MILYITLIGVPLSGQHSSLVISKNALSSFIRLFELQDPPYLEAPGALPQALRFIYAQLGELAFYTLARTR